MDRILDSGSNDWGSTPHGCTPYKIQYYLTLPYKWEYTKMVVIVFEM